MNMIFDIFKIESLINQFHKLTNLVITFCDSEFTHIASSGNWSEFCTLINKTPNYRCNYCDTCALMEAQKQKRIYSYICHAGLLESIVPILYDNIIIAYIIIGEYRDTYGQYSSPEKMLEFTSEYGINQQELLNAYQKLPILSDEQIESVFEIFKLFVRLMWKEGMIKNAEHSQYAQISSYIDMNLKSSFHVDDLCKHFFISKNTLYKLVYENSGMTVVELIRSKRINHARHLLMTTDLTITQIAEECGFSDPNYFIRTFKKCLDISPLKFRKTSPKTENVIPAYKFDDIYPNQSEYEK